MRPIYSVKFTLQYDVLWVFFMVIRSVSDCLGSLMFAPVLCALLFLSGNVFAMVCDDKDSRKDNYIAKHNLLHESNRRWYSIIPLEQDLRFYGTSAALSVAHNIVTLQMPSGGWRKNISPECDLLTELDAEELVRNSADHVFPADSQYHHNVSTLDNNATHTHIRFLLRVALYYPKPDILLAIDRGIRYLLDAQYKSGGWPQNFPNLSSYGAYVTFNDGAMVGALRALQEVSSGRFVFLAGETQAQALAAYNRGIRYVLDSQVLVGGQKTGWAQQYLPGEGYVPARGRIYEIPAIATKETVGIIKLLRRVEAPSNELKYSVNSAIKWLEWSKLNGLEVQRAFSDTHNKIFTLRYSEDPAGTVKEHRFDGSMYGYDKTLVPSENAEPIWAEYYDLSTLKPVYAGWDGVATYRFEDVDYERRVGYGWFIPHRKVKPVLGRAYPDVIVPDFIPNRSPTR